MSTQMNAPRGARQLVEDYRRLQQQLALAVGGTGAHVVAFTAPAAGCGRATLCSNLAILTAQSGKRVLVVDADLYAPAQHRNFRIAPGQGLADAAAGLCRAEDCLMRAVAPGVDLLPAGTVPGDPAPLLGGARFPALLAEIGRGYDLVFMDAPDMGRPCAAAALSAADGAVLAVRSCRTRASRAAACAEALRQQAVPLLGIVVTGVPDGRK